MYVWKRWFNNGKKNILIGTLRREETRVGIVFLWEKTKTIASLFLDECCVDGGLTTAMDRNLDNWLGLIKIEFDGDERPDSRF